MARTTKIKSITHKVLGEDVEFPIKINWEGVFSTIYPQFIREKLSVTDHANTLSDLKAFIEIAVKTVNDIETVIEWILVYKIKTRVTTKSYTPCAMLEIVYTPYRKTTRGREFIYNHITYDTFGNNSDPDCPIANHYVLSNTVKEKYYDSNDTANPFAHKANILPLTQANLDFFNYLANQLNKLNESLLEFLGTPDELQEKILIGNIKNLLGG